MPVESLLGILRGDPASLNGVGAQEAMALARRHAVLPLAAAAVAAAGDRADPDLRREFAAAAVEVLQRNLAMTAELLALVAGLEARNIPAIPFKGPLLAEQAYGSVAMRQFVDLDVLVERAGIDDASAMLEERGFTPLIDLDAGRSLRLRADGELGFRRADGLTVELHWRVVPRTFALDLPTEELFARSVPARLAGREVRSLSPEDLVLALCAHGAKHQWEELGMIADLHHLWVRGAALDVALLLARARAAGAVRMLQLGCALMAKYFDTPLPPELAGPVPRVDAMLEAVERSLARPQTAQSEPGGPVEWPFHISTRERAIDRVRYVARNFFMPTAKDWAVVRLPRRLAALYYPIRLGRLAVRYAGRPLRRPRPVDNR